MIPTGDNSEEMKQTNEIKIAPLLLGSVNIEGKNITGDALLTQRALGEQIVENLKGHYFFTVKNNQRTLLEDIEFYFDNISRRPDAIQRSCSHGREEDRRVWVTQDLEDYLRFPYARQAFKIERQIKNKKTGKISNETVYGITSRPEEEADAETILEIIRKHWTIENSCHYILDWAYDEDRCRIRKGNGPEVISRIRRFAIGLIKSKKTSSVTGKMNQLNRNIRAVFDYLKMTSNSQPRLGMAE
jgi:predicted transposase YbfD/YdcC